MADSSDAVMKQDLESVKRQLAIVQHPPENRANTPTWLRLNFNEKGEPTEISGPNIHWSWLKVPEKPRGIAMDWGETAGSLDQTTTMATLLFLSIDSPIETGPLSIEPSPASLPQLDTITQNDRQFILWFHGQIINRRLDIVIKRQ